MIFGKYINRYYLRHAPTLLLGILSRVLVGVLERGVARGGGGGGGGG